MKVISCPICNSTKTIFFAKKDSWKYFRCICCQHLFLDPKPTDKILSLLYSGDYEFRVDDKSLLRFILIANNVLNEFKRLKGEGRTLLDIGTGYGTFVEVAVSRKFDAMGIEPARNLYNLADRIIKNRILHTDLHSFVKSNKKKFDFITLIHVIEHVKEPEKFLTLILRLLNPGGVLYLETPNSNGHLAAVEKGTFTFLTPPDHINLFSKKSLDMLVKSFGKTYESSFHTYSYPEHFVGILRSLKNGKRPKLESKNNSRNFELGGGGAVVNKVPFFDRVLAPFLTPLLNIGNNGSFIQVFIHRKV